MHRLSNGWLDDNSTVTSKFLLALDPPGHAAQQVRAHTLQHPPVPMFRAANGSAKDTAGSGENGGAATVTVDNVSAMGKAAVTVIKGGATAAGCKSSSSTAAAALTLPYGVHLLSFDVWNASAAGGRVEFTLLVRLAHLLEHGEAGSAATAAVHLDAGLFRALVPCGRLIAIRETTLAATPLPTAAVLGHVRPDTAVTVELQPLDVRTFLASFGPAIAR